MPKFTQDKDTLINKIKSKESSDSSQSQQSQTQDEQGTNDIAGHTFFKQIASLQRQNSFFKKVILLLLLIIVIALVLVGYLSSVNKIDLAIVHTSSNNQIIDVSHAKSMHNALDNNPDLKTKLAIYFVENFLINARSVSVDQIVNQDMKLQAFSYLQDQAYETFKDYLANNDPSQISKQAFIKVTINTLLKKIHGLDNMMQVSWTEVKRTTDTNEIVSSMMYTAQITFRLDLVSPADSTLSLYNPLGFYITNISWSRHYTVN